MELTLNAARPRAANGLMRRFSTLLHRKPTLYLSLLLVPPLLWFGAIYLGSLLTLLWQGFYTFDDFTMTVSPELTLANFAALNVTSTQALLILREPDSA